MDMFDEYRKHILREKRVYLFLLIELFLTFALLSYSFSHVWSGRRACRNMQKQSNSDVLVSVTYSASAADSHPFLFRQKELAKLNRISGNTLKYAAYSTASAFTKHRAKNFYVMFCTNIELSPNVCMMTNAMFQTLQKSIAVTIPHFRAENRKIRWNGHTYSIRTMSAEEEKRTVYLTCYGDRIAMRNCIIFSANSGNGYNEYLNYRIDNRSTVVSFDRRILNDGGKTLLSVQRELDRLGKSAFGYTMVCMDQAAEEIHAYASAIPDYLLKMSVILLLMVTSGLYGMTGSMIRRRQGELALREALGGEFRQMLRTFSLEFFSVLLIGSLAGCAAGGFLIRMYTFRTSLFHVTFVPAALLIALGWSCMTGLGFRWMLSRKLGKHSIAAQLS